MTKDLDFRDARLLRGLPRRLLLVRTGNITNVELFALVSTHLDEIAAALEGNAFVELAAARLLVHEGGV